MCTFEGHGHCNSFCICYKKKRDTEDFNVFYLPKKFYVVFYACWWFSSWIYKYSIGLN